MCVDERAILQDRIDAGERLLRTHEEWLLPYADKVTLAVKFVEDEAKARKLMPDIFDAYDKGINHKRWLEREIAELQERLGQL
jgi:hypothetical protein